MSTPVIVLDERERERVMRALSGKGSVCVETKLAEDTYAKVSMTRSRNPNYRMVKVEVFALFTNNQSSAFRSKSLVEVESCLMAFVGVHEVVLPSGQRQSFEIWM